MYNLFEEAIEYESQNKVHQCDIQRDLVVLYIFLAASMYNEISLNFTPMYLIS